MGERLILLFGGECPGESPFGVNLEVEISLEAALLKKWLAGVVPRHKNAYSAHWFSTLVYT